MTPDIMLLTINISGENVVSQALDLLQKVTFEDLKDGLAVSGWSGTKVLNNCNL